MTSETDKIIRYLNRVEKAGDCLAEFQAGEPLTFAVIRAQHVHVADAHRELKKACWFYRRRLWVRRFIYWGEQNAVMLGYLSFEEVEKP